MSGEGVDELLDLFWILFHCLSMKGGDFVVSAQLICAVDRIGDALASCFFCEEGQRAYINGLNGLGTFRIRMSDEAADLPFEDVALCDGFVQAVSVAQRFETQFNHLSLQALGQVRVDHDDS